MWILIYVYLFTSSFALSVIFTILVRYLARRLNILDHPGERKIHKEAIPLLGGIAIFLAFNIGIILNLGLLLFLKKISFLPPEFAQTFAGIYSVKTKLLAILGLGFFMMLLGLIDDLKKLSPFIKLSIEIIFALIIYLLGIRVTLFFANNIISVIITVLWIVGITNAFNLMDNMDGLSSGTAAISSIFLFIIAAGAGQFFVASILMVFVAVILGFLKFNFPPAKIFMGDAGSLYIGFIISILAILETFYTPQSLTAMPVIMPILILAVPIFDTLSVIYIRLCNKKPVFSGDTNHFSHRLIRLGMNTRQVILFIYLVAFCLGLGALLLKSLSQLPSIIVLIQAVFIILIIVILENTKNK